MVASKSTPAPKRPVLFLDDWPPADEPDKAAGCAHPNQLDRPGMSDIKKWRLQTLLAANPWGIPSLAFGAAYRRAYDKELEPLELGYRNLFEMVSELKDIFAIQEPTETTAIMFPSYPKDKILHDARFGHDFVQDQEGAAAAAAAAAASHADQQRGELANDTPEPFMAGSSSCDPNKLITHAWLNRDEEFPGDVALAGDQYPELILPLVMAKINGTLGVHRATIVGAAHPNHVYINVKSAEQDKIAHLSAHVTLYFRQLAKLTIDAYAVPDEFIYPKFPCLVFFPRRRCWERCSIVGRAHRRNKVVVETVDYGGSFTVDRIHLYLMPRQFLDIPKQGVAVSMAALRPSLGRDKWTELACCRLRTFSIPNYWFDCLLLDPCGSAYPPSDCSSIDRSSDSSLCQDDFDRVPKSLMKITQNCGLPQVRRQRRSDKRQAQYEIIFCDRNNKDLNLFLDEVLIIETYASIEENRLAEILDYRQKLAAVLAKIKRSKNPLASGVDEIDMGVVMKLRGN